MIFGMTNVYALDFTRTALTLDTNNNPNNWVLDSTNTTYYTDISGVSNNINLNTTNTNITGSDYIYLSVWARLKDTSYNSYLGQQIDWNLTCSNVTFNYDGVDEYIWYINDPNPTPITGDIKHYWCNQYNLTGSVNATTINDVKDLYPNIQVKYINNDGLSIPCMKESDSFKCPLQNGKQLRKVNINITNSGGGANYRVYIQAQVVLLNQESTSIINNQNQNTNTINNSIQDTKDFISSDIIDSSTITNTEDIGNLTDTDSKNVVLNFLMIPVNFFSAIINSYDDSCSTVCVGDCGSGHDNAWFFTFPCINLQNLLGQTVYNIIDGLFAFGMIFAFLRSVVKFIKKALLLTEDVSSEVGVFL